MAAKLPTKVPSVSRTDHNSLVLGRFKPNDCRLPRKSSRRPVRRSPLSLTRNPFSPNCHTTPRITKPMRWLLAQTRAAVSYRPAKSPTWPDSNTTGIMAKTMTKTPRATSPPRHGARSVAGVGGGSP